MAPFRNKEDYLEEIKTQIRCKKARNMVTEEIQNHIEDQKNAYLSEGMEEPIAMEKALEQMGDPVTVGKQLDQIHRPRMEWCLLLLVIGISLLGILIQISMSQSAGEVGITLAQSYRKHIVFLFMGLILMFFAYFIDYIILGKYPKIIWTLLLAGIFLYVPFAHKVNGNYPFLYAYVLLLLPVYGGILYAYRNKGYFGILKCLFVILFTEIIVWRFVTPCSISLGLLLSFLIMLSIAAWKDWFHTTKLRSIAMIWGWILVPVFAILFKGNVFLSAYQFERLQVLWNPSRFPNGYQINLVREIIANAKLFGESYKLETSQSLIFNTDYLLTFVVGKYGLAAGILIVCLFILFLVRMTQIALKQKNALGMFVGFGCVLVYAIQGIVYIFANLSISLFAQVNLPFISYSGSSLLVNFIVLGIMLSIFRNANIRKEEPYKKKIGIHFQLFL